MLRRPASALAFSMIAVLAVTLAYACLTRSGVPKASSLTGHVLGIVGLLLMLSTELLYSLRKRVRRLTLGRMSVWLEAHIFTGIVGSYLVLLHSGGKFHGLAGATAVLTVVIVASGFVGRYLYTAMPRTLDGVEVTVREMEEHIATLDERLRVLGVSLLGREALSAAMEVPRRGWLIVLGRGFLRWRHGRRLRRSIQRLSVTDRVRAAPLEKLLTDRYRLLLQIQALPTTRRLLSVWHMAHVPLGVVLFTLAFVHVGGAVYYATLLK
jgi:hypothetical protein